MSLKPKVALSQDFLLNLSKLPSGVQSKVMKWAILFQSNPKSTSINYENIHAASDTNMKSVRIDGDWRCGCATQSFGATDRAETAVLVVQLAVRRACIIRQR